jgi:hypothetical protein
MYGNRDDRFWPVSACHERLKSPQADGQQDIWVSLLPGANIASAGFYTHFRHPAMR